MEPARPPFFSGWANSSSSERSSSRSRNCFPKPRKIDSFQILARAALRHRALVNRACPFRKFHPIRIRVVRQNHRIIESDDCDRRLPTWCAIMTGPMATPSPPGSWRWASATGRSLLDRHMKTNVFEYVRGVSANLFEYRLAGENGRRFGNFFGQVEAAGIAEAR
jgi:hypothetical protein